MLERNHVLLVHFLVPKLLFLHVKFPHQGLRPWTLLGAAPPDPSRSSLGGATRRLTRTVRNQLASLAGRIGNHKLYFTTGFPTLLQFSYSPPPPLFSSLLLSSSPLLLSSPPILLSSSSSLLLSSSPPLLLSSSPPLLLSSSPPLLIQVAVVKFILHIET